MKVQKNSLSLLFALFLKWHFRGCLVAQFGERDEESFFLSISRLPRFVFVCVCAVTIDVVDWDIVDETTFAQMYAIE